MSKKTRKRTLYKVVLASGVEYTIDPTNLVFWPTNSPEDKGWMWPRLNPNHPDFWGEVVDTVEHDI